MPDDERTVTSFRVNSLFPFLRLRRRGFHRWLPGGFFACDGGGTCGGGPMTLRNVAARNRCTKKLFGGRLVAPHSLDSDLLSLIHLLLDQPAMPHPSNRSSSGSSCCSCSCCVACCCCHTEGLPVLPRSNDKLAARPAVALSVMAASLRTSRL